MKLASPLRYPGGKWRIASFFERLISINCPQKTHYVEPYAGGGSLALSLLFNNAVEDVHLNDLDPAVHACWSAMLRRTGQFLERIEEVQITPDEWHRQRDVYARGRNAGIFELGFATFFLNRTNHSGILNGGMIGGKKQEGRWKIDARFNKIDLQARVRRIGEHRSRIHISRLDALTFLQTGSFTKHHFVYLDPPYYSAGNHLYLSAYGHSDHLLVEERASALRCPWVISYDDVPEVRKLFRGFRSRRVELLHSARDARTGNEVLFFSPQLRIPNRPVNRRTILRSPNS